jgi:hypothetical protein
MRMLTRRSGIELAKRNIVVVRMGRNAMATPINRRRINDAAELAQLDTANTLRCMARPEEIARADRGPRRRRRQLSQRDHHLHQPLMAKDAGKPATG